MSRGKPDSTCWDCGAPNTPGSSECWLCQRRDWNRYPGIRRRPPPPPAPPGRSPLSTIAGLMIGIAIFGVAIALFREAPGIAFTLLISVAPALAITEMKARGRRRRGDPMPTWERVVRVLALTILIPILVLVSLGIAVLTICFFFASR